jgi:hypothetical protein
VLLSYGILCSASFHLAHLAGPAEPGRENRAHQGRLPFLDRLLLPLRLAVVLLPPPPGFGLHTIDSWCPEVMNVHQFIAVIENFFPESCSDCGCGLLVIAQLLDDRVYTIACCC